MFASRVARRFWALWAVASLLGVVCFLSVGVLLASPSEPAEKVDVVIVLGGGGDGGRYARGRELIQAGYCDRLALIGATQAELRNARVHVPQVLVWDDLLQRNSWGEAEAARDRMRAIGYKSAMVVSDPPHMLRLLYTWGSVFRGTDLRYTLVATNPAWWPRWKWWSNASAAAFVRSELLKLGYYVLNYRFGF